jgi:hypothetical protein
MKRVLLSACLLSGYAAVAQQDLAYKIPEKAGAVVTVRGNKLLELLSASEFNNSVVGKKMMKEMSRKGKKGQFSGVEDFGLNLASSMYYYNMQTDSISYNCILLPLNDAAKFERLLEGNSKITREGGNSKFYSESDNMMMTWNNEMVCIVFGDLKKNYFEDSTRAARYGIKEISYSDYYYKDDAAAVMVDTATEVAEVADYPIDIAMPAEDTDPGVVEAVPVEEATPVVEAVPALEDIPADAPDPPMVNVAVAEPDYNNDYDKSAYEKAYEEQRKLKQQLRKEWISGFANKLNAQTISSPSILNKKEFSAVQDKTAAATLYLGDIGNLYRGIFPYLSYSYFAQPLDGYKSMNAQLYLDKEQMRITSDLTVDDKKAASYKKLYGHKLNSKFAKYVNSDKLIGFVSYSFDTEEYLKELPNLLSYAYTGYSAGYSNKYKEELDIASELITLILDEKAIAKVVKGDALLLVTDVAQKEYTYKTYEYNDDYERKEIERKKKETLPEFLFMMSSEDTRIIERLLNYGIHKGLVNVKNGIYTLDRDISKSPLDVHLLIKDGIVFCGTSLKDIQDISLDRFQGNISKEQKKLLMKSNATAFFNPKQLAGKIPEEEFHSSRRLDMFNYWMNGTGKFYAKTTGIKGNHISGEMIAEVPQGKENALKYFFSLIESASKMD